MNKKFNFSIVVPLYNEEDNIERLIKTISESVKVNKFVDEFEIIAVDDGSSDGTVTKLITQKVTTPNLKIIRHKNNYGQSAAWKSGFENAKYELIGVIDGDLQTDPDEFEMMIEHLIKDDLDCVTGARFNRKDSIVKRFSTWLARKIRNKILNDGFHDITCPLKVFKKSNLEGIQFFNTYHRFLPYIFKIHGFKVKEIGISHYPRKAGKSKYGTFDRLFVGIKSMYSIKWISENIIKVELDK